MAWKLTATKEATFDNEYATDGPLRIFQTGESVVATDDEYNALERAGYIVGTSTEDTAISCWTAAYQGGSGGSGGGAVDSVSAKDASLVVAPTTGAVQANVQLSKTADNSLKLNADGLYVAPGSTSAGVSKIIAGNNIAINPTSGTGDVTISAVGAAAGGVADVTDEAGDSFVDTNNVAVIPDFVSPDSHVVNPNYLGGYPSIIDYLNNYNDESLVMNSTSWWHDTRKDIDNAIETGYEHTDDITAITNYRTFEVVTTAPKGDNETFQVFACIEDSNYSWKPTGGHFEIAYIASDNSVRVRYHSNVATDIFLIKNGKTESSLRGSFVPQNTTFPVIFDWVKEDDNLGYLRLSNCIVKAQGTVAPKDYLSSFWGVTTSTVQGTFGEGIYVPYLPQQSKAGLMTEEAYNRLKYESSGVANVGGGQNVFVAHNNGDTKVIAVGAGRYLTGYDSKFDGKGVNDTVIGLPIAELVPLTEYDWLETEGTKIVEVEGDDVLYKGAITMLHETNDTYDLTIFSKRVFVPQAPNDGQTYGMKNGAWVVIQ